MSQFKNVDEILDFAIKNEEMAHDFYMEMASKSETPHVKKAFEEMAGEEKGHKQFLLQVKTGKRLFDSDSKIPDLKIADYIVEVSPHSDMTYQEILTIVMKQEKAAFKLYSKLAEHTSDPQLRKTFQNLAKEEAAHKLKFETEYEDVVMQEN